VTNGTFFVTAAVLTGAMAMAQETLPPLAGGKAPRNFEAMWAGFDPRAEPLDVETLKEWEEDGVVLRVLRYRIGVFKGGKAMMAAVYGFPKGGKNLPGLVQIHGGGQYADYRAPLLNAKRGYATISLAWAGRINAPGYKVTPREVKLFWDGKTDDPSYRLTTDWGALDAYHAPSRHPQTVFPAAAPTAWTLHPVESPRNSPWFLCALAARRALTFLEQQPEVDASRLGVYGHSMGGKLTVMTAAADSRVKAAAPSCGGVSDRHNASALYRAAVGDDANLRHITCPIIFLNPSNDFHARINDLPKALKEIRTSHWRITSSPHHNHQDTPEYMVCGMLWFDQWLKGNFRFPETPQASLQLKTDDGVPTLTVRPDASKPILAVDVFYTQQGREGEDMENAIHRFWHYARPERRGDAYIARLPLHTPDRPLWAYANVTYPLERPVTGAGYYYRPYTACKFVLSSPIQTATPAQLRAAGVRGMLKPSLTIETFEGDWEKNWFTYNPEDWARRTHKIYDDCWKPPAYAKLAIEVRCEKPNRLVVGIDEFAAEVKLEGGAQWQTVVLFPTDFQDALGRSFLDWSNKKELRLAAMDTLRAGRGAGAKVRRFGAAWQGRSPEFRRIFWMKGTKQELDARRKVKLPKATPQNPRVYLSPEFADVLSFGVDPVHYPKDRLGNPLSVGGKTYKHCMTLHAPSEAAFFLGGRFDHFHAIASAARSATVVFKVVVDGREVFNSGLLKRGRFRVIDLPVKGARELRLIITDGGNGKGGDWAHWVDAWVKGGEDGIEHGQ